MYKFFFPQVIPSTVDLHAVAEGAKKYIVNLNTRMCSSIMRYHVVMQLLFSGTGSYMKQISVLLFIASRISKMLMTFLSSLSRARVHGIYQVIFQILNWCRMVQKEQQEDPNLNGGRDSQMWNSRGQKAHAVDAIRLDTIGRLVQIILYKNNDVVLLNLCFWGFTLL